MATLTYVFNSATAVLGPLGIQREPNAYDLCELHAARTTVPVGWEVIRLPLTEAESGNEFENDDLVALAQAVREVGFADFSDDSTTQMTKKSSGESGQIRHLRVIRSDE